MQLRIIYLTYCSLNLQKLGSLFRAVNINDNLLVSTSWYIQNMGLNIKPCEVNLVCITVYSFQHVKGLFVNDCPIRCIN